MEAKCDCVLDVVYEKVPVVPSEWFGNYGLPEQFMQMKGTIVYCDQPATHRMKNPFGKGDHYYCAEHIQPFLENPKFRVIEQGETDCKLEETPT